MSLASKTPGALSAMNWYSADDRGSRDGSVGGNGIAGAALELAIGRLVESISGVATEVRTLVSFE